MLTSDLFVAANLLVSFV